MSSLLALRHTTAELLACALCELFPDTLLVNTVTTDIGFHYDVILKNPIDDSSLAFIEERMRTLAKKNLQIQILEMMRQNAVQYLTHHGQRLRADAAAHFPHNVISLFNMHNFIDIHPGICLNDTSEIRFFKLQEINELPNQITRISGTVFPDPKELKLFLKRYEAAKEKDHRQLGEKMRLFVNVNHSDTWIWTQKGSQLRDTLVSFLKQLYDTEGFQSINTPKMLPSEIFPTQNSVKTKILNVNYQIYPDPTATHLFLANREIKSSIPLRYYSITPLVEETHESQLNGLFNTRNYEKDLAHIFCEMKDVAKELISSLQFIYRIIKIFGFECEWCFYTHRTAKEVSKERWDKAVKALSDAMKNCGFQCTIDKTAETKYGPSVEIRIADALGRFWSGPRVTFDVTHSIARNKENDIGIIARTSFGSLERFIALLIEHYEGDLPFWLMPEQIRVIAVSKKFAEYASQVYQTIKSKGYRVGFDDGSTPLSERVSGAEQTHVPYMVMVGDKEVKQMTVTVRSRKKATVKNSITIESFLEELENRIWVESK